MNLIFSNVKGASSKFYYDSVNLANDGETQMYLISSPWIDGGRFKYTYSDGWTFLKPGYPITFVMERGNDNDFKNYIDDLKEDLGHIVNKYNFSHILGRQRDWNSLFCEIDGNNESLQDFLRSKKIYGRDARKIEIMISLLIGSVNQAENISLDEPQNLLDKIKNKIVLFDTDQTRFLYQKPADDERIVRIQGLAGTGKTELLLHKIKDLFINFPKYKICLTCYNRVLADVLSKRLISFFNLMGVDRQIDCEKLLCFHSWGSYSNPRSGALRYISEIYDIPFYSLRDVGSFDNACKHTIENLEKSEKYNKGIKAFDYMFIDESQDFSKSFIDLCEKITRIRVYVAGDIFQNIFTLDNKNYNGAVNIILNKCYRTDPRTFLFAHGMGMGVFEKKKISWLSDEDWHRCGYIIEKIENGLKYKIGRKPVKRFEDIPDDFQSIKIFISQNYMSPLIKCMDEWKKSYPNIKPDDVGIIMIDDSSIIYDEATKIAEYLERKYGWTCNLAYDSKKKIPNTLFISNRNNVKGLEFPFVICFTHEIKDSMRYRHTLYTMLSRSHLQTILIVGEMKKNLYDDVSRVITEINNEGKVVISVPTEEEQKKINDLNFRTQDLKKSIVERIEQVCIELGLPENSFEEIQKFFDENIDVKNMSDDEIRSKVSMLWELIKLKYSKLGYSRLT